MPPSSDAAAVPDSASDLARLNETQPGCSEAEPNAMGPRNAVEGSFPVCALPSTPSDAPPVVERAAAKPVVLQRSTLGSGLGGILAGRGPARPISAPQNPSVNSPASASEPTGRKPAAARPISVGASKGGSLLGAVLGRHPATLKAVVSTGSPNPSAGSESKTGGALLHSVASETKQTRPGVEKPQFTLPFAMVPKLSNPEISDPPTDPQVRGTPTPQIPTAQWRVPASREESMSRFVPAPRAGTPGHFCRASERSLRGCSHRCRLTRRPTRVGRPTARRASRKAKVSSPAPGAGVSAVYLKHGKGLVCDCWMCVCVCVCVCLSAARGVGVAVVGATAPAEEWCAGGRLRGSPKRCGGRRRRSSWARV